MNHPEATVGSYQSYSAELANAESARHRKVVLFFHAAWCPYCRAAEDTFLKNPERILPGVSVLKVDYDSSAELKKKYGVTTQHTFVQIDSSGNLVAKWISGDIEALKKNIQ